MYQKILLCYDGSKEGRNALKEGADIAIAMHAETYLLAVIRTFQGVNVPEGVTDMYFKNEQDAAAEILNEGIEWLKARGLNARGHIAVGDPIRHIPETARALQTDLIVVAHRPSSSLARWWSDGEDATLLERTPCSILVAVVNSSLNSG